MKARVLICSIIIIAMVVAFLWMHKADSMNARFEPTDAQARTLLELGQAAIASGDVPVAAILLLDDSIIGQGFNTVLRDRNAGGHAEVNAVSDAMRRLGNETFNALDRKRLLLVSTFEPCGMCTGMMLEYRIEHVAFIEPKGWWHHLREEVRWCMFQFNRRRSAPEGLQDSLFRMHPQYDPERMDH